MSYPALILGESGSGKSSSLKGLDPAETLLIQALAKPLPFSSAGWRPFDGKEGSIFKTDSPTTIQQAIQAAPRLEKSIVVIDDFQYVMANDFMRRSSEKGFDKFTEIGRAAWDVLMLAASQPEETRIYFLWHTETTPEGRIKAKTIGKMLDEKITIEGMFSIVLRCFLHESRHVFSTITNGADPVKTPVGMFPEAIIENSLSTVDQAICNFYGVSNAEN